MSRSEATPPNHEHARCPTTADVVRVLTSGRKKSVPTCASLSSHLLTKSPYLMSSPVRKHLVLSNWTQTTDIAVASTDTCQASIVSIQTLFWKWIFEILAGQLAVTGYGNVRYGKAKTKRLVVGVLHVFFMTQWFTDQCEYCIGLIKLFCILELPG